MTIGAFIVGVIGEPRVGVALPVGEATVGEREEVEGEKGEDGEDGANESAARRCLRVRGWGGIFSLSLSSSERTKFRKSSNKVEQRAMKAQLEEYSATLGL